MKKGRYKKDDKIISIYSREDAIADGILVEIFKDRWLKLSGGKPILATAHLSHEVSLAGLMEIWNKFVEWNATVKDALPEEKQLFVTDMNGKQIWLIEDADSLTMMYPDDY